MTLMCRVEPFLGANGTFARTVHNGAERRINIFLRHFIMVRVLDGHMVCPDLLSPAVHQSNVWKQATRSSTGWVSNKE